MTCGDIFSFHQLQYDTDVRAAYDLSPSRGGPPNLVVTNMHEDGHAIISDAATYVPRRNQNVDFNGHGRHGSN